MSPSKDATVILTVEKFRNKRSKRFPNFWIAPQDRQRGHRGAFLDRDVGRAKKPRDFLVKGLTHFRRSHVRNELERELLDSRIR
jgi:hypothetical protein